MRIGTAACVCALHLALLVPQVGGWSSVLQLDFAPEADAIQKGDRPYDDQELEYPPLSIPVIVGPALISNGIEDYESTFQWEMIGFDLAIVALLALGLQGDRRRVWSALGVYTAGIVSLSGILLDGSAIDKAPLAISRFDLVPAFLVLAACLARERERSATWSALLSLGATVKAFPLLLYPPLLRGERSPARVAVAGAIPLLCAAVIVIVWGDDFSSAITYHTSRELQVETVAATPFEIAHVFGAGASSEFASGSFNIVASGVDFAQALSLAIFVCGYAAVLWAGWRRPVPRLRLASALLAITVTFAPVLSPQFLLWMLPVSAAAFGLGRENVALLCALILTQLTLQNYEDAIGVLNSDFVWRVAARNLSLLVYLALVCVPILRPIQARALPAGSDRTNPEPRAP